MSNETYETKLGTVSLDFDAARWSATVYCDDVHCGFVFTFEDVPGWGFKAIRGSNGVMTYANARQAAYECILFHTRQGRWA